jgi:hypothetical protein
MYIKSFPFRGHGGPKRVYNVYNERDEYLVTFRLLREAKDFIKINQGIPSITVAAGLARNLIRNTKRDDF